MAARTDQKWSAALIRRMARLADQEMSTAQIAKALGLTRGQVLGKMHRLGLKTKNPPRESTMAARTDQKWVRPRKKCSTAPAWACRGHLRVTRARGCRPRSAKDSRSPIAGLTWLLTASLRPARWPMCRRQSPPAPFRATNSESSMTGCGAIRGMPSHSIGAASFMRDMANSIAPSLSCEQIEAPPVEASALRHQHAFRAGSGNLYLGADLERLVQNTRCAAFGNARHARVVSEYGAASGQTT
jgi:hypothetical protein